MAVEPPETAVFCAPIGFLECTGPPAHRVFNVAPSFAGYALATWVLRQSQRIGQMGCMIRIVHLSDLHFSCTREVEDPVRAKLLLDIKNIGTPDIVAITGDLTTRGGETGFIAAESWIDALVTSAKLREHRVFLVPGNHDVDQFVKLPRIDLHKLQRDPSQVSAGRLLNDHSNVWSDRHKRFLGLMNKYLKDESPSPWWNRRVQIGKHWVSLLGLCSTWLSGIKCLGPDKGRLFVGWPQFESCMDFSGSDLNLALIHHPWSYLVDYQELHVSHAVSKDFDIVLRGHRHRQATAGVYTPDRSLLELEAGACGSNGAAPAAYQYIEFDPNHREAKVHYRVWKEPEQEWVPDPIIYGAVGDDGIAVYYLPQNLVKLRKQIRIEDSLDKNTRTITIPSHTKRSKKHPKGVRINTLTSEILCAMIHAIKDARPGTIILITGEGKQFCSGLETDEMQEKRTPQGQLTLFYELLHVIDAHPPVVALINGPAVAGGAGIALFAHYAVACKSASITIPSRWPYRKLARTLVPFVQHRRKPNDKLFRKFLAPKYDKKTVRISFNAFKAKKKRLIDEVCDYADQLEATAMRVLADKHFNPKDAWYRFREAIGKESLENLALHWDHVSGK